jgi:hypothetical protein
MDLTSVFGGRFGHIMRYARDRHLHELAALVDKRSGELFVRCVRPWELAGEVTGRGPDNEPLVVCREPVAWSGDKAMVEAEELVAAQGARNWGPLDRAAAEKPHRAAG